MDVLEPGNDELAAACWSPEAISNLQYTALHDQAVKVKLVLSANSERYCELHSLSIIQLIHHTTRHAQVRRATMHTFSLVAIPNDQSSGLIRMLVQSSHASGGRGLGEHAVETTGQIRDRDVLTASHALVLLLQLPYKLLAEHCSLTEWASIMHVCLTRLASGAAPWGKAALPSEPGIQTIKKFVRCITKELTASYLTTMERGPAPISELCDLKRARAIVHVMHPTSLFLSTGLAKKLVEAAIVELML
eukprot:366212-Chlamydomonas_euryale.AAC.17